MTRGGMAAEGLAPTILEGDLRPAASEPVQFAMNDDDDDEVYRSPRKCRSSLTSRYDAFDAFTQAVLDKSIAGGSPRTSGRPKVSRESFARNVLAPFADDAQSEGSAYGDDCNEPAALIMTSPEGSAGDPDEDDLEDVQLTPSGQARIYRLSRPEKGERRRSSLVMRYSAFEPLSQAVMDADCRRNNSVGSTTSDSPSAPKPDEVSLEETPPLRSASADLADEYEALGSTGSPDAPSDDPAQEEGEAEMREVTTASSPPKAATTEAGPALAPPSPPAPPPQHRAPVRPPPGRRAGAGGMGAERAAAGPERPECFGGCALFLAKSQDAMLRWLSSRARPPA